MTERHPFYINKLCDRLWTYCQDQLPSINQVNIAWHEILIEEKSDIVKEISLLPLGQKKVLQLIAGGFLQLTSKLAMMEMTSSSITTALDGLEEKDIIEKDDEQYLIINPILKFYAADKLEKQGMKSLIESATT